MIIIVTSAIGVGKTTVCEKVIATARGQGYICSGVITRKARNEDIVIEDIRTGETRVLASTGGIYQGPRTAKYFFNPEGIDFGIQVHYLLSQKWLIYADDLHIHRCNILPSRLLKNPYFTRNDASLRYKMGAGFRCFTPFSSPC